MQWVFEIKHDLNDNIKRYKIILVAKKFIKKNNIGCRETFSLVSNKESLRIIMVLVSYYDLDLHQMNVKNIF